MGSFSFTCCVSGLPITAGDKVRYLLLSKNTFETDNHWSCSVAGRWKLRCFPVKASYNDYGSVDKFTQPFLTRLMWSSFQQDVVERGIGDNACHDVAVRRDMNEKEWLTALWEGRVFVRPYPTRRRGPDEGTQKRKVKVAAGIPTRRRIEKALVAAGFIVSSSYGAPGFMADHIKRGFVRVRAEGHNDAPSIERLQEAISKRWPCLITAGTGNYADKREILVAPAPGAAIRDGLKGRKGDYLKTPIPIAQAMVREDVWQALLGMAVPPSMFEDSSNPPSRFREDVQKVYDKDIERIRARRRPGLSKEEAIRLLGEQLGRELLHMQNLASSELVSFSEGRGPGYGLKNAWADALDQDPAGDDLKDLLDGAAETLFVQSLLADVRFQWFPYSTSGPQFGEWRLHEKILSTYAGIAKAFADEQDREYGEEEVDDEEDSID
jgi:hypothetical protein